MQETIHIKPPAAPGNGATVKLFDSTELASVIGPSLRHINATLLSIIFLGLDQASATDGLKVYGSIDRGANWKSMDMDSTFPATVAVVADPGDTRYKVTLDGLDDCKVEYTAGGTGPSVWNLSITLVTGGLSVLT